MNVFVYVCTLCICYPLLVYLFSVFCAVFNDTVASLSRLFLFAFSTIKNFCDSCPSLWLVPMSNCKYTHYTYIGLYTGCSICTFHKLVTGIHYRLGLQDCEVSD